MDRNIGKILDGRYKIVELTGIGGMANVYKAIDMSDEKTVALKLLKEEYLTNSEFVKRFKNESKAISLLAHPNIVKVYDVCFDGDMHAIIMEYVDGITLKEYISAQGKLSWKEAVYFAIQILRALQHAHDKGIVHRDIKPHNIMLLKDGTIKVMDFGIARFARSETMTVSDKTIGSVHYISPEQARGGQVTDKADIYSLGVMMFEMLTGTLPFVADSPVSVALKQIQDIPKKPRDINPDIPLGLEQITLKAMQKDASRRYQSAAEMLKDLVEFKRNPNLTFGYKYSKIKENTRMFEPIDDKKLNEYYEEDYEEQVRKSPVLAILSGVGAGFVIAALFFVGYIFLVNNPFKPVEDIQVPYLIGSTYEEARSNPDNSGLRLVIERAYNAEYGEGVIFAQEPSAGRTIKASNPVVKIKVSRGMEYSEVPDVVDLDIYVAIARIKDAGLTYIEVPMTDDFVAENSVIKTSPPAKTKLPKGTSVTVYVSRGEEKKYTDVPDVVGLNINDAIKIIEDKNLVVGAVSRTSSDKPYNTVIAQDPTDSLQIMEGDIINLVISYDMTSLRKLVLPVELPNIDRTLKIEALADGITMGAEYLNPVQDISTWKPTIEGSGVVSVRIEIDDVLYKVIALDFDNNTYWEEEDHSEDLMEQLSNKTDEQDEIIDETEN